MSDLSSIHEYITLQTLPAELLAEILSELDLSSLAIVSCLSRRLRDITADVSLNPWRRPILRNLYQCHGAYEKSLLHLSVRSTVPRQNWIEILTFASSSFLLFDSTLPNLKSSEWEECFRRRFLPGWIKWKKNNSWRETFMGLVLIQPTALPLTVNSSSERFIVYGTGVDPPALRMRLGLSSGSINPIRVPIDPRPTFPRYVLLNRNGSVNELEAASRNFNPLVIFHEMKLQNNLADLPTQIRVVLQLMDVRILALGVVNHPRTHFMVNHNAHSFLRPPGLGPPCTRVEDDGLTSRLSASNSGTFGSNIAYHHLSHPTPSHTHSNFPMYTPGGGDQRWHPDAILQEGMQWVGGLMITVQLRPSDPQGTTALVPQGFELFDGIDHAQFASFTWKDFLAIAPWMEERISKCIYGQGLGIH